MSSLLADVSDSILSPPKFSSHYMLRQRVLFLWWQHDYQVATDSMVSQRKAQANL
ncbi:hypothetical protein Hanom_Chr06g00489141 [Helianthus anomalus]